MKNVVRTVGYVLFFVLVATAYVLRPMKALAVVPSHHRGAIHADEKTPDASNPASGSSAESDAEESDVEDEGEDDVEEGE